MKKLPAVILLEVGALAMIAGLAFLYLMIILWFGAAGILISIAVTIAAEIGIDRLRRLFRKKYELKAPLFFVLVHIPSMILSVVYFAVIDYLDNMGYFKGLFAGLGEFLFGISWLITSAVFIAVGGHLLLIFLIIGKKRDSAEKLPPKQPEQ